MMNTYVWSAKKNQLLPVLLQENYIEAGSWPDDTVDIADDIAAKFMETPPAGKNRGVVDGMPAWVDVPLPTPEQYVQQAERQKTELLNDASNVTNDWRTELALGIITDDDKASLIAWMAYVKALKAVDLSTAPNIAWPTIPTS